LVASAFFGCKRQLSQEGLITDTENGGNRSLSVGDKAYLLVLLILGVINLKNVVSTLQGFVV
jgi:hypothetical protein